ncbi:butyrate kinase [Oikeobacillus pervagus]|uniref:butyrate kinase n=1 Tax=Oikeobacillus pervagus TaxID=1325931 RepID=UPI0027D8DAA9|nr:butyrate kinase [Oikeobacillus pervagus]
MKNEEYRILVINPSSISTKIGVFHNKLFILEKEIVHEMLISRKMVPLFDQLELRKQAILETLDEEGINLSKLNAVVGKGGLLFPIEGGTYTVNDQMLEDLEMGVNGYHVSNLGAAISFQIATGLNIPAFIVDPLVVDELQPIARISGMPHITRKSIFHALNQKAIARRAAITLERPYEDGNFIVVHMGNEITVGAHKNGKVIDVNNGLHGEGPFGLTNAGTVPAGDLVNLFTSGDMDQQEISDYLLSHGGVVGYLGTNDLNEVEALISQGNEEAKMVFEAMAYQIAKEIASQAAALVGKVDAIILTGDLAHCKGLVEKITRRTHWIADILVYPGENELLSLAEGALRVLKGEETVKDYNKTKI